MGSELKQIHSIQFVYYAHKLLSDAPGVYRAECNMRH